MDRVLDPSVACVEETLAWPEPLVRASQPFVGQWSRLVSTTNWEKGRIILAWRAALEERGLSVTEYSDEAWARLVGGISSQHVGRLRRVYQRFGEVYRQYPDLYWSHFCAALDWDDAEMWLEGAQRSGWSVAQMQRQRWQTLGGEAPPSPPVASEWDEDAAPLPGSAPTALVSTPSASPGQASGPWIEGPDFGDEPADAPSPLAAQSPTVVELSEAAAPAPPPFEHLPPLPDDLSEALEALKLAIVRHRAAGWKDVAPQDVLLALEGLKALLTAAS
jgi:hypothetical protein